MTRTKNTDWSIMAHALDAGLRLCFIQASFTRPQGQSAL